MRKGWLSVVGCLLLLSFCLAGCASLSAGQSSSPSLQDRRENPLEKVELLSEKEGKDIVLRAKKTNYVMEKDRLIFEIENSREQEERYGWADIAVDVQIDGAWYRIPQREITMESILLPAHAKQELSLPISFWSNEYEFHTGRYRVVFIQEDQWTAVEFNLTA